MSLVETRSVSCPETRGWPSLRTRLELWRTRRALAKLDADALRDIGLTEKQARNEASLTVWDVPDSWKRC